MMEDTDGVRLVQCHKPDCLRKVRTSVRYCCPECATADEHGYEIDKHGATCDERAEERGEIPWTDLPLYLRL
jgi:hypothetical protein